MSQFFIIHPDNPQPRLIKQAVKILQDGGVIIYPTDSAYAMGCKLENKSGADRIRKIRQLDEQHNFTLVCRDLTDISMYAIVDNAAFRLLKANTPGPYTFILKASRDLPRRLMHPKRNTIGLRIPDNKIVRALLDELKHPIMSVTFTLPNEEFPMVDAHDIYESLGNQVDLVIDGGPCGSEPTTIVDVVEGLPKVTRLGKGNPAVFG
jgi:tRNA threonylcarbamoyl adenosine modification protein (Sua5/YciO/YrdC/YwlC family)